MVPKRCGDWPFRPPTRDIPSYITRCGGGKQRDEAGLCVLGAKGGAPRRSGHPIGNAGASAHSAIFDTKTTCDFSFILSFCHCRRCPKKGAHRVIQARKEWPKCPPMHCAQCLRAVLRTPSQLCAPFWRRRRRVRQRTPRRRTRCPLWSLCAHCRT